MYACSCTHTPAIHIDTHNRHLDRLVCRRQDRSSECFRHHRGCQAAVAEHGCDRGNHRPPRSSVGVTQRPPISYPPRAVVCRHTVGQDYPFVLIGRRVCVEWLNRGRCDQCLADRCYRRPRMRLTQLASRTPPDCWSLAIYLFASGWHRASWPHARTNVARSCQT